MENENTAYANSATPIRPLFAFLLLSVFGCP